MGDLAHFASCTRFAVDVGRLVGEQVLDLARLHLAIAAHWGAEVHDSIVRPFFDMTVLFRA